MATQFGVEIPKDVTQDIYFKTLLPKMIASAKGQVSGLAETVFSMEICIGGRSWGISINKGEARITEGPLAGAIVKLETAEDNWRDTVTSDLAETASFVDIKQAGNPQAMRILQSIKGQLTLELARPNLTPLVSVITFNGDAGRKAKMKWSLQDFMDVQAKKANPQMLFMQGRIMIEGDMGLIMQLQPLQNL